VIEWVDNCECDFSSGKGGTSTIIKIAPVLSSLANPSPTIINIYDNGEFIPIGTLITAAKVGGGYYRTGSSPVGQPCSQYPLTAQFIEYVKYGDDCKECTITLATWKPGDCKNPATLIFTSP